MKKKHSINRRDFINGVSYGLAASIAPIDFLKANNIDPFKYPHVIGRKSFGNISIANSDSGGSAYVDAAIVQADRAVNELL